MPGRLFTALTVPGGSVSGTTQVNGFTVPVDLALSSRTGNEPTQYVASRTIDLDEGFESADNDDVTAYLTDTSYAGTGNGGSGADGVAGASKYPNSFNGKRKDNEIQGEGNTYEYGAREYDPRGPRFWSVDPLQRDYPMLSPYQYAGNNPIAGIDLDGKEFEWAMFDDAEKYFFGTTHLRNIREGFAERAMETAQSIYHGVKDLITNKANTPIYENGATTLTAGMVPGMKPNINPGVELGKQIVKNTIKDYGSLVQKAFNGDDKAIGALGFEAMLAFFPGGEEAKSITFVPRGFKNAEQFTQVGKELAEALEKSGIKYEQIGITGSAVTGVSSKGGGFRPEAVNGMKASDIDVFVVLSEDIPVKGGTERPEFIHPTKMMNAYPALKEWSAKWSELLKRKITPAGVKPLSNTTK